MQDEKLYRGMEPLVSICIPAFNASAYIKETIECLLSQTYPHIEIIVVNDGSTDNTAKILDAYTSQGIKVIHQQNNGQCAAANTAYRANTGTLVKFFDADDLLSKDFILLQVERLMGRTEAVASAEWGRFTIMISLLLNQALKRYGAI